MHSRLLGTYAALIKPRITALLLFVAAASFLLGSRGRPAWDRLAGLSAGIGLLALGSFTLNQLLERETDARMPRTRARPLPAGRIGPPAALKAGLAASLLSLLLLALTAGWLTALLGLLTLVVYLLLYTPLKRRTPLNTAVGAVSGAMPVLLGWSGATGGLEADAWVLFAVLFLWQFPHFLAIGMLYRQEYAQAGFQVLPAPALIAAQALLLPAGALPALTGLVRPFCLPAAAGLGAGFLLFGILALRAGREPGPLRRLVLASVGYLGLLFALLLAGMPAG